LDAITKYALRNRLSKEKARLLERWAFLIKKVLIAFATYSKRKCPTFRREVEEYLRRGRRTMFFIIAGKSLAHD